ncbi:hypothetical protein FQZ97_911720 [compost metagenome]
MGMSEMGVVDHIAISVHELSSGVPFRIGFDGCPGVLAERRSSQRFAAGAHKTFRIVEQVARRAFVRHGRSDLRFVASHVVRMGPPLFRFRRGACTLWSAGRLRGPRIGLFAHIVGMGHGLGLIGVRRGGGHFLQHLMDFFGCAPRS